MKLLFLAAQQFLLSALVALRVNYIQIWDDQLNDVLEGNEIQFAMLDDKGDTPPVFIEFPDDIKYNQLGNGVQTVDDLEITLHVLHEFFDAGDGTFNQDLKILATAESIFQAFQEWMPGSMTIGGVSQPIPVGVIVRVGEMQDKKYANVYHFKQKFRTTWIDSSLNRPVGGILAYASAETIIIQGPANAQGTNEYYYN